MKRLLLVALTASLVLVAVALSGGQKPTASDLLVASEDRNPWTHLRLNNNPAEFRFLIVSDRTGGHRPRVFSEAIEQMNLLQPEFVLSVGDLIEGYTENAKDLAGQWKEFQGFVGKLQMPFFYVVGNHDITNAFQDKDWKERFGRRYYHFVYRDVLFLMLCTEDPPRVGGKIGPEQIKYVQKTLKENPARWTVVCLHRPMWANGNVDKNGWLDVEKALAGRQYTVFCGHEHTYQKFERNGRLYYQLATTGGGSRMRGVRYGEFDHVVWVTMKKDGPLLANVLLDGVYPENLKKAISDEKGAPQPYLRPTHPVTGKVFYEGCPAPNAQVIFHFVDPETKRTIRAGDALVEADGAFTLSTFTPNDGGPAGEYIVTVTWRDPPFTADGQPGPNRVPEVYSRVADSPLRAQVRPSNNAFTFELKKQP
jgi:predicted phosphodiesterase